MKQRRGNLVGGRAVDQHLRTLKLPEQEVVFEIVESGDVRAMLPGGAIVESRSIEALLLYALLCTQPKPVSYTVGYGRPPKETQFVPGKSGNPKGRPKDHQSALRLLRELITLLKPNT